MSDNWGMSGLRGALPLDDSNHFGNSNGTTNDQMENANSFGEADANGASTTKNDSLTEARQEFEKAGWVKPERYDYTSMTEIDREYQWGSAGRVYHWDGQEGDVGPEYKDLEDELFGPEEDRKVQTGHDFTAISEIEVIQEGPVKIEPVHSFNNAGLHPVMRRNVELAGYEAPTPIQKFTIPAVNDGYDIIGIAQTGSGKTAAYLVPVINKLMGKAKKLCAWRPNPATFKPDFDQPVRAEPLVVIVAPNRELAIQIFDQARKFCYRSMLRPCVIYGGAPVLHQIEQLGLGCDILVATPGRLIDFMQRPRVLSLHRLKYMVIDEADEMLHEDWAEEMGQILSGGNQDIGSVKFLLFSATFPKPLRDLAKEYLAANHVRFRVGRAGSTHRNIRQAIVQAEHSGKRQALLSLLSSYPKVRTIIFVNSKRMADEIDDFLYNIGLPCTSMHSDRTQKEREAAMRAFRAGTAPILIATGISARGIDVRNVMHVINYDLPSMDHGGIEEYVHRIGRTGRIGHHGVASSIYTDSDEPIASVLTRTLLETNQEIPEFLQHNVPEGESLDNLKFEADSDFDPDEMTGGTAAGATDAWGTEVDVAVTNPGNAGDWETPAAPAAPTKAVRASDNAWGAGGDISW